jgi:hypothetical protein
MPQRMRLLVRWSAWLCLSLMFWTAAVESTHNHPSQTDAATCSICVAAHSTRPTTSSVQTAPVFATVGLLQEKPLLAKARLDVAEIGIRGPPVL